MQKLGLHLYSYLNMIIAEAGGLAWSGLWQALAKSVPPGPDAGTLQTIFHLYIPKKI